MSAESLERLLLVQARDTALDQLRHRRAALPERAELEARRAEQRTLEAQRRDVQARRDLVHAEERRLDDLVRGTAAHAAEVDKKLYSGTVASPRELQAMQADLEMLRRQVSDLEDQELELMEQREALDTRLADLDAALATAGEDARRLADVIAVAEREIDTETASEESARRALAAEIDPALVADYERRRARNKGAGAARLVGTTCQACHLTIPSTEAERVRRAAGDEIAYCDNCGAILVP